jgi:hypothetical protein
MIDINILALLTGKWDLSGIFCLAAIPCLIIALIPYAKGIIAGAGTNFILFLLVVRCAQSPGDRIPEDFIPTGTDYGRIANESQTKWLSMAGVQLDEPNSIYHIFDQGTSSCLDDKEFFIPSKELKIVDGRRVMKATGHSPEDDDYYRYDIVYSSGGIPQWVYHPAAPIYIFGVFGLPAMALGFIIHKELF